MSVTVDVGDLARLAADLGKSQLRVSGLAQKALAEAAIDLRDAWRANARATAGSHGKWYPSSIKVRPLGPFAVEVGPTPGMRQGAMSFEFGSSNQPPHLDGQRALDATEPGLKAKVEALAVKAL